MKTGKKITEDTSSISGGSQTGSQLITDGTFTEIKSKIALADKALESEQTELEKAK